MPPAPPRCFARAARALSHASSILALVVLVAWVVGRLASDRWTWSQYMFWIPQELSLFCAATLCIVSWLAALLAGGRRPRAGLRIAVAAGCAALAAHLLLVNWRIQNYLTRPAPGAGALRILNWNVTSIERDGQIAVSLQTQIPDVAVLVNPMGSVRWHQIIAAFPDPKALIWESNFLILSHLHIIRHGVLTLGIEGAVTTGFNGAHRLDPGRAMFLELDTTATLGRSTVIWVVDLPSDWRMSRWDMAARAAAAIRGWSGVEHLHDHTGGLTPHEGGPGFPAPDIVLGDFNSPRGSVSQRQIVGDMTEAFDQAGAGRAATWPDYGFRVPFPVFQLDHIFLARWLRAVRYDIVKPQFCYHRPQIAEIAAK